MPQRRIFSGIQPTGRKHLGNYIGAIRHYVEGQEDGEGIYCIVDLHAITVPQDPSELRERLHDTAAILIAAGLDPERCILFRQSDVAEHTELCWLLTTVTAWGDLNRMHQFKEKSEQQRELVSAGLFLYPVLQAADVLAYRAEEVPVGDDQRQHIELMRDIAERFNSRFGDVLVVPEGRYPEVGARLMNLQEPAPRRRGRLPPTRSPTFARRWASGRHATDSKRGSPRLAGAGRACAGCDSRSVPPGRSPAAWARGSGAARTIRRRAEFRPT